MGSSRDEQSKFLEEAKAAGNDSDVAWATSRLPCEGPQHWVRITRPFYLGKLEVTQSQWQAVMGNNPSRDKSDPTKPVEQVSCNDFQPFLIKLNQNAAADKVTFALPTEAQWEYACRAGTTTYWSAGDVEHALRESAWYGIHPDTHPVGRLRPNPFGLHDMYGNVWEFCADWYAPHYYAQAPLNDPSGPEVGTERAHRGGGRYDLSRYFRSAYRIGSPADFRYDVLGFRVAAVLPGDVLRAKSPTSSGKADPGIENVKPSSRAESPGGNGR